MSPNPTYHSPADTTLVQRKVPDASIGRLPLTLPAVRNMLLKLNPISHYRDPAGWERVEEKYIADILTWMSIDTHFHQSLRAYMTNMATEIPKVYRVSRSNSLCINRLLTCGRQRFFIYQLVYIAMHSDHPRYRTCP